MASFGGYTLLHYVCASGNADILEFIISRLTLAHGNLQKSLSDQENQSKETPLHWAVLKNNYHIVKRLIAEHRLLRATSGLHQSSQLDNSDAAEGEEIVN